MVFSIAKRLTAIASIVFIVSVLVKGVQPSAGTSGGGTTAQGIPAPAEGAPTVRLLPAGQKVSGTPGQKGATYYWLEGQTKRVTTAFADATVVAERGADGDLHTRVHDLTGTERARFTVDRVDGASEVLQYVPTDGNPMSAINDSGDRATLDWAARQAYTLSKSGTANLEWNGGLMRAKPAVAPPEPRELETEWANGLTAKVVHKTIDRHEFVKGRFVSGAVLKSQLRRDGVEVGTAVWFVQDRIFAWDIPGLSKGWLGPEHLKDQFGNWPFVPDMAWLNLQVIAFHHFKTAIVARGFVARQDLTAPQGWAGRVASFLAPTLLANEPGCDGLHWLDGTIFRFCCDVHDMCYTKYGCNSKTWWMVWTNWRCDVCNAFAVDCFLSGGGDTWNPGDA